MTARDMRDMLGLTDDVARPPPQMKRKVMEKRPLEKGMAREVSALMGERAPPVSMIQVAPKYKQRPKRIPKSSPWEFAPFTNSARSDSLELKHWMRKQPPRLPKTEESTDVALVVPDSKENGQEEEYKFAKYNVQIDVPTYTDQDYDDRLKDENWTKEETDYLVSLVKDYAQKWPVIFDRYDFQSSTPQDESATLRTRPMEDLKARYYKVNAKMLEKETPVAGMNGQQYTLYKTLNEFDPVKEAQRKKLAQAHLYRTQSEVDEETFLLSELQRIMINQQALEAERKDIRERLDYPVASSSASGTQYSTSQALGTLFSQLLAADRAKKDRAMKLYPNQTPSTMNAGPSAQHRDSIATPSSAQMKRPQRDSIGSTSASRALSPHSNHRYFVSTHDRLSSGVSFASDKLSKPRVAKSTVQTERIASVLQYLKIPDLIPLPTQKVVEEFDKLMSKVGILLDMRKLGDKEEGEIKVRVNEKRIVRGEKEGQSNSEVKTEGPNSDAAAADASAQLRSSDNPEPEADAPNAGHDGETRGHKRGASEISQGSQQSNKRPKSRHGT